MQSQHNSFEKTVTHSHIYKNAATPAAITIRMSARPNERREKKETVAKKNRRSSSSSSSTLTASA